MDVRSQAKLIVASALRMRAQFSLLSFTVSACVWIDCCAAMVAAAEAAAATGAATLVVFSQSESAEIEYSG